jgi:hypothetical protein
MMFRASRRSISGVPERAARGGFGFGVVAALLLSLISCTGKQDGAKSFAQQKKFASPEAAAESLIHAAEMFDIPALKEILGPSGVDLVITQDEVQDRNQSAAFASEARQQHRVVRDPQNPKVAILSIGVDDWPLPIPLVEQSGSWYFDSEAGRQEVLYRRIGMNELDAIEICRGYVEAQHEYATEKHDGAIVNQYAQRVISTPCKKDRLAWQAPDGSWQGPIGKGIAAVIAEGYTERYEPYHGYFFKILKGQGPAAPLGEMDFVVQGVMIGGFALVAAPAEYGVTGVKTFIVSHYGVVYEKDLGPETLDLFRAMERFDPDSTWSPVADL